MEKKLEVLIVEDEAVIAQLIEFHVEEAGHTVVDIAHNSEKALDLISNLRPDLILLDINILGSKDGIEVGLVVKEKYNIPIIFITALSDLETIERAKAVRPVSYLIKPYKSQDLLAAISIGMYNYENRKAGKKITIKSINEKAYDNLSVREFEILVDIEEGLTNDQIAAKQFLALNTVKWHTTNIYSKLGVNSRTAAAKFINQIN